MYEMLHGSIKKGIPKFVKEIFQAKGVQRLEKKQSAVCEEQSQCTLSKPWGHRKPMGEWCK